MPHGILVIDKPRGPTSHDVVGRVRKALGTRAVGHAGTLDPMATGVLVIALGEATKLMPWLTHHDKVYSARIALGLETDTCDAWGVETRRLETSPELREALCASKRGEAVSLLATALDAERNRSAQIPPAYSAIHFNGERAYERARRGEISDLAPRPVAVYGLTLVDCCDDPPSLTVTAHVSKGYYVRALARDLGAGLRTFGHLIDLRRIRSGAFSLEGAAAIDASPEALRNALVPLAEAASRTLPVARLTGVGADDARQGRSVSRDHIDVPAHAPCAWLDPSGCLVAVGQFDEDGRGRVIRGFCASGET
jgi:tRNA pseudouridine55 synthase